MRWLIFLLLLTPFVLAECYRPVDLDSINNSVVFCSDTFDAPNGIYILASDIVVDCNSAVVRGDKGRSNSGIILEDVRNVTLMNCNVATYANGILLRNVTFSRIVQNNLLKNDVGIRMFDSFENRIVGNNDKSLVKSVSAINSKYNVVSLGNKGVDEGFCDFNACNVDVPLDPCVDGDGYCSVYCNEGNDDDCRPVEVEAIFVDARTADEIIEELEQKIERPAVVEPKVEVKIGNKLPIILKVVIYIALYLLALFCFQVHLYLR